MPDPTLFPTTYAIADAVPKKIRGDHYCWEAIRGR